MNKLLCLVVDDEPIARDILNNHIGMTPNLKLVKSCINASEAYEALHRYPIDLIFLDIQMPVITGTDFLRSLRRPPLVVLTTAYQQYAIEGFELNVVDYLLKPITFDRFYQAVQKASDRLTTSLEDNSSKPLSTDHLFIKQDSKYIRVDHHHVRYIQAEKDYSSIYLEDRRIFASMHLKLLENLLPETQFQRIHRSYIVNLSKILAVKGNMVELAEIELPVGANYRDKLLAALKI
ncbi:LytR/AlgR family response regulator transcription factor [Mucilaginibacter agri]|uniref:Response regulator n=1 Tax=Mucilaginibacter agri TaxID=2695265 RepID=A0A966DST3_9SPHI|nr:response regulator transcription factor [Mucilaginibacter agri]NCD68572.1 response regulator [Mucilaginibacter agri]